MVELSLGFLCGALLAGTLVALWLRGRHLAQQAPLQSELATLKAVGEKERESAADKLKLLEQTREEMTLRFKQLSQEIFDDKSARFAAANQQGLEQILKPLRDRLSGFETQIKDSYEKENRLRIELVQQISTLRDLNQQVSADAKSLAVALRGETKTQGAWGEMILEKILEASGLTRGREYETQFSTTNEQGERLRPDAVVHLPEGRDLVIDSKVSLTAYVRTVEAADAGLRAAALAEHVASFRSHIRLLSDKQYQSLNGVQTLDFVLMFVPSESAYIEALRADPALPDEALRKNIALVSPSTLLPTLRTVEYLWKVERQNLNAKKIAEEAGKLYDQFVIFEEALSDVGDALNKAQKAQQLAHKRLSESPGNVVSRLEKLREMGAKTSRQLPEALRADGADEPGSDAAKITQLKP